MSVEPQRCTTSASIVLGQIEASVRDALARLGSDNGATGELGDQKTVDRPDGQPALLVSGYRRRPNF